MKRKVLYILTVISFSVSAFYMGQTINGNVYFFDKNNNKVTGEQIIQGIKYNFTSEGILAMNNKNITIKSPNEILIMTFIINFNIFIHNN